MFILPIFLLPTFSYALVDCFHGFVGRMQASLQDNYFHINDTAMCSAVYCIKVIVHSAVDDDGIFQQGISSRCAYTGGDRQVCNNADGKCQDITFYDGMKGNFSFCCCKSNNCNASPNSELDIIYEKNKRSARKSMANSTRNINIISVFLTIFVLFQYFH